MWHYFHKGFSTIRTRLACCLPFLRLRFKVWQKFYNCGSSPLRACMVLVLGGAQCAPPGVTPARVYGFSLWQEFHNRYSLSTTPKRAAAASVSAVVCAKYLCKTCMLLCPINLLSVIKSIPFRSIFKAKARLKSCAPCSGIPARSARRLNTCLNPDCVRRVPVHVTHNAALSSVLVLR
jgi:ferredoxin